MTFAYTTGQNYTLIDGVDIYHASKIVEDLKNAGLIEIGGKIRQATREEIDGAESI